jgi:hypothetical protein
MTGQIYVDSMKNKQKEKLAFGDLIVAAYQVWGKRLAPRMVKSAIKWRLVAFDGHSDFLGSPIKGRFS